MDDGNRELSLEQLQQHLGRDNERRVYLDGPIAAFHRPADALPTRSAQASAAVEAEAIRLARLPILRERASRKQPLFERDCVRGSIWAQHDFQTDLHSPRRTEDTVETDDESEPP